jgi:hypothetical protein
MRAAVRRSEIPQNTGSKLYHEFNTNTHPHTGYPTTRKPQRRTERMLPMASDYVGVSSSPSTWSADLNRRVCEWEVSLSDVVLSTPRNILTIGSLSGRDAYEPIDAAQLYHEHDDYRALSQPLQIPQDGYAHGQYAYASHSSGATLSGKRITSFNSLISCYRFIYRRYIFLHAICTCYFIRSLLVVAIPASLGRWSRMSSGGPSMACSAKRTSLRSSACT